MKKKLLYVCALCLIVSFFLPTTASAISLTTFCECPICQSTAFSDDAKQTNDTTKSVYLEISEKYTLDEIYKLVHTTMQSQKPVKIDIRWFKEFPISEILQILLSIEKKNIVSLSLCLPEYKLTAEDESWILSLSNLVYLSLQVKETTSILHNLKKLNYLTHFNFIGASWQENVSCLSPEKTLLLLNELSDHQSLEYLSLGNVSFPDEMNWKIGPKVTTIMIGGSCLTTSALRTIGQSSSLLHIELLNCKFPNVADNNEFFFHSQVRCLLIHGYETNLHDRQLSLQILNNLSKLPELKLLLSNITEDDLAFVKDKICHTDNTVKILLFFENIKSQETDDFIAAMRKDCRIYIDYYCNWMELLRKRDFSCVCPYTCPSTVPLLKNMEPNGQTDEK